MPLRFTRRKGTNGEKPKPRDGRGSSSGTTALHHTRSSGPPVAEKKRKDRSAAERLDLAKSVVEGLASGSSSEAAARAATREAAAKRRGDRAEARAAEAHDAVQQPTGGGSDEADGPPSGSSAALSSGPQRKRQASGLMESLVAEGVPGTHLAYGDAATSDTPLGVDARSDASPAESDHEADAAEPSSPPSSARKDAAQMDPALNAPSGATPDTEETGTPRHAPPLPRTERPPSRMGALQSGGGGEDGEADDERARIAAKVEAFGGLCWWCLRRCDSGSDAHDPDKCEQCEQPDMSDFSVARPAATRGAQARVKRRGHRQAIRNKLPGETDEEFDRRRRAVRERRKRALLKAR